MPTALNYAYFYSLLLSRLQRERPGLLPVPEPLDGGVREGQVPQALPQRSGLQQMRDGHQEER